MAEDAAGGPFIELRRRNVLRVAAMYGVVAWVLLQIGDVVFEPVGLPAWSQTMLLIFLALGFPIALALAWIFDLTPQGIVRTAEVGAESPGRG